MNVDEKVKNVISTQLGILPDYIKEEHKLVDDLSADDLDIVELIMALEEEIQLQILDEEFDELKTVKDVVEFIRKKVKK